MSSKINFPLKKIHHRLFHTNNYARENKHHLLLPSVVFHRGNNRYRATKIPGYLNNGDLCSDLLEYLFSTGMRLWKLEKKPPPPLSHGLASTGSWSSSAATASLTATAVVGVIVELISWSQGVVMTTPVLLRWFIFRPASLHRAARTTVWSSSQYECLVAWCAARWRRIYPIHLTVPSWKWIARSLSCRRFNRLFWFVLRQFIRSALTFSETPVEIV